MRTKLILFVLLLVSRALWSQQIILSSQINVNNKFSYSKILGENERGLYVLRFRDFNLQKEFIIDRYTSNLDLIQSQTYQMDRKEIALKFILADTELHVITKSKKSINHYTINYNLNSLVTKYEQYALPPGYMYYNDIKVEYSTKKKWVAICLPVKTEQGDFQLHALTRTLGDSSQQIYKIKTNNAASNANIETIAIDDIGRFTAIYSNPVIKSSKLEFHWLTPFTNQKFCKNIILNPYNWLQNFKIKYHPSLNQFAVLCQYNFQADEGTQGIALFWESKQGKGEFIPFDPEIILQLSGSKMAESNQILQDFFIRNVIPNSNFGFTIGMEQYYINRELETFMVNGMPQTGTNNIYNYNDIVVLQTDSTQSMEWNRVLRKKQECLGNYTYYTSYLLMAGNNTLSFLYNESPKIDNRIMLVNLNKNGDQETKVLLDNNGNIMQSIPVEGKQTTFNSFVLPVQIGKGVNLLKVLMP